MKYLSQRDFICTVDEPRRLALGAQARKDVVAKQLTWVQREQRVMERVVK